jgi:hypothetical protein
VLALAETLRVLDRKNRNAVEISAQGGLDGILFSLKTFRDVRTRYRATPSQKPSKSITSQVTRTTSGGTDHSFTGGVWLSSGHRGLV